MTRIFYLLFQEYSRLIFKNNFTVSTYDGFRKLKYILKTTKVHFCYYIRIEDSFLSKPHLLCTNNPLAESKKNAGWWRKRLRIGKKGRVSVQGVKSLGGHFAYLCREFDSYEVKKYYYFSIRKGKYFYIFNHFYSEKSSKRAKKLKSTRPEIY